MFTDVVGFCITNNKLNPVHSQQATIQNTIGNIHKSLLTYCFHQDINRALIFENQLTLSKNVIDIDEIQRFIDTNNDWDMVILGECPLIKDVALGYTYIYNCSSKLKFITNYPYIASKRFLAKIKNNNRSSINTYIYHPSMCNTFIEIDNPKKITDFTVGRIDNLSIQSETKKFSFSWKQVKIE